MCTVTIFPRPKIGSGDHRIVARMACNRDESPLRPPALPPVVRDFECRAAVMPIDPVSGGMWIAGNDAGLAFALLNVNRGTESAKRRSTSSRGLVLSKFLHCSTLPEVAAHISSLPIASYAPHRIVATDGFGYVEARFDSGYRLTSIIERDEPVIFTSSGLGDALVRAPREALFREFVASGELSASLQDGFHRHRWSDRPEWSVCMSRKAAQTVSYTTIDIERDRVVMNYFGAPPNQRTEPVCRTLPRAVGVLL